MASPGRLSLPTPSVRPVDPSDEALTNIVRSRANWVWTGEYETWVPPLAPEFEQRAFRMVFTFSKKNPTSAKLVIGADDYFALYIDGVMVQPADGTHDWQTFAGYQVPLPVVRNTTADTMTLALRVVNEGADAGLIVGVQVNYESGEPDILLTGHDGWIGEKTFEEGWEQPGYAPPVRTWERAVIFNSTTRDPNQSKDLLNMKVFEQLPASAPPTTTTTGECTAAGEGSTPIGLSVGGFVGVLIGSVLVAISIGVLATFLVMQKEVKKARGGSGHTDESAISLVLEPNTSPGRPLYPHGSSGRPGGVAPPPQPDNRYLPSAFGSGPGVSGTLHAGPRDYPSPGEIVPPTYPGHGASGAPQPVRKGRS